MNNGYTIIRESNVVEVLRHFFHIEATRLKYAGIRDEMLSWSSLPDADLIRKTRNFAQKLNDINPTLIWTVGINNDHRHLSVRCWVLANINLGCLYTKGINPKMQSDLDLVHGNLKYFVDKGLAVKYNEFSKKSTLIEGEAKTLIGIGHAQVGLEGHIELVDGAHRVVSMLTNGARSSNAYIGVTHKKK